MNGSASDTWVSYMAANDHTSASAETAAAANLTDHGDGTYDYGWPRSSTAAPRRPARPTTPRPPTDSSSCSTPPATRSRRSTWSRSWSRRPAPTSPGRTTRSTARPASSATPRSAPSRAARASSARASSTAASDTTSGPASPATTISAASPARARRSPSRPSPPTGPGPARPRVLNREAVINLPVFIHKIHMGEKLTLTGGTYQGVAQPYETTYPQDIRNCAKCHRAPAPLADNWKRQTVQPGLRRLPRQGQLRRRPFPTGGSCTPAARSRTTPAAAPAIGPGGAGGDTAAWHTPVSLARSPQHLRGRDARRATATPTPPTSRRRAPFRRAPA